MKKFLSLLVLLLFLAACGNSENDSSTSESQNTATTPETEEPETEAETEEAVEETEPAEAPSEDDGKTEARQATEESGEWEDADFGEIKAVGFGYNDEIGIDGTEAPLKPIVMGPMSMEITGLAVVDIKPDEDSKELYFNDMDLARAVIIDVKVENTVNEDVTFDPNSAVIVTSAGEQLDPDMFLTSDVGGDFLGKVKKEGQIWWLLNDVETEVTSVKLIILPPYSTDEWEDLSEEKRLEFEVLNQEEATARDES